MHGNSPGGYSLIEMVIVILILGIVATIAAPRLFRSTSMADQEATRRHLIVLRNAIDMHHQRNESYPANGELPGAMASMLNGPFPAAMIGSATGKTGVYYDDAVDEQPVRTDPSVDAGWAYKPHNGSLRLNVADGDVGSNW